MATNDLVPEVAVVYYPEEDGRPAIIVTVVWRTYEQYVRAGTEFRTVGGAE